MQFKSHSYKATILTNQLSGLPLKAADFDPLYPDGKLLFSTSCCLKVMAGNISTFCPAYDCSFAGWVETKKAPRHRRKAKCWFCSAADLLTRTAQHDSLCQQINSKAGALQPLCRSTAVQNATTAQMFRRGCRRSAKRETAFQFETTSGQRLAPAPFLPHA